MLFGREAFGAGEEDVSEGVAMEVGKIRSSRFIASSCGVLETAWADCRSCAIPEGAEEFACWLLKASSTTARMPPKRLIVLCRVLTLLTP